MIQKKERRRYASDLSDRQWAIIQPLFPQAGNRSKWEKRALADAVLYFVENGCKWRNLPHDFPPYTTVANFYYAAIRSGLWEKTRVALVEPIRTEAGYRKTFEQDVSSELGLGVDISTRIKPEWEVLPKRWIVERSLAWNHNSRRLSKDYEISVCSAQAVCTIAAFRTLLKRF